MPTIRRIYARDFIETRVDGTPDFERSRRILLDIACANAEEQLDLLIDVRRADDQRLSFADVYRLLPVLQERREAFAGKIALLDEFNHEGFAKAQFFEASAGLHGFQVRTFTAYEAAMRWLQSDSEPILTDPAA